MLKSFIDLAQKNLETARKEARTEELKQEAAYFEKDMLEMGASPIEAQKARIEVYGMTEEEQEEEEINLTAWGLSFTPSKDTVTEEELHTGYTDWYEINGVSRGDFF